MRFVLLLRYRTYSMGVLQLMTIIFIRLLNLTDLCVSTQKGGHKTDGFSNIVTLHSPIFLVIVD